MFIQPVDINTAKQLIIEQWLNRTTKISKVSPASILQGYASGAAKAWQRASKDAAIIEAEIFPDSADGQFLDIIAQNLGIAPRFGALGSSTYLRLVGDPGTTYIAGTNTFSGPTGITFELVSNYTIGVEGFIYAQVRSDQDGAQANVPPLSINSVSPVPGGHKYVVNEYQAVGGQDFESDFLFRARIKKGPNILARGTLAAIEQAMMLTNPNVLSVYNFGFNSQAQIVLAVASVNGADFSLSELSALRTAASQYLCLSDMRPNFVSGYGLVIQNIVWYPIDISYRVQLVSGANPDTVRINSQIAENKYLDYRTWQPGQTVRWLELAAIAETIPGVQYLPGNYFYPNFDITIPATQLPRVRGFELLDANGNLIIDLAGNLNPVFYPANPDFAFRASVLRTIS